MNEKHSRTLILLLDELSKSIKDRGPTPINFPPLEPPKIEIIVPKQPALKAQPAPVVNFTAPSTVRPPCGFEVEIVDRDVGGFIKRLRITPMN